MKSIIVRDLDIKKDEKVNQFLNTEGVFKEASKTYELNTSKGQDALFCDLYDEWKPESFEGFREKIASTFNNKLDIPLEKWFSYLTLDRGKLQQLTHTKD